ncbi:penicillin acylase family protein [Actinophytocola algeriensis]|uniref:Penicillin amidase n=1 Tax=Actinophytocola algeriensis TaxID=1768010 RepID=A0A7W7Q3R8_9PSEU|nr:penicillin acylase family protein [Actinophytocola algeriensis]MBB4906169.1 penicillin amidase [Actinophytocola algeriensis]MBE1472146.1 penicillin amidase [Actinophytocola algeriensis]
MTACAAHRPRRLRLRRLPSVRAVGGLAVLTLAAACAAALTGPMWTAVAVVVAGAGAVAWYARHHRARIAVETALARALLASVPACPDEVAVPGLDADVRATVTGDGVTRLTAASWLDAVRGLGFVMGRDRGFHLDLVRRTAGGRLAEVWGRTAVPADRHYRLLGLERAARRAADTLDAPERDLLTAFAAGVNASFAHDGPPFESRFLSWRPEPWTVADSLLVALFLFHALSWHEPGRRAEAVIRRALPPDVAAFLLPGGPDTVPAGLRAVRGDDVPADVVAVDGAVAGSNCWVRTGPGGPVLACDLHLPLLLPNLLYEVDLRWPDGSVHGLATPGLPVVLTGGNGHLVWGVTNLSAAVLDLVPAGAGATTTTEHVRVRGGAPVAVEVTVDGDLPVLPKPLLGERVAAAWTGFDPRACDLRFQRLATARTVAEGIAVLDEADGIALNALLADRDGRIAHLATGLLPERPRLVDPPSGVLVSANDAALPGHPFWYDADPGHRARRIRQVLADTHDPTPDAMRALQHDTDAALYRRYRDLAVAAPAESSTVELLAGWDGTARTGSRAFPVLVRLRQLLAERVLAPYLTACRELEPEFRYPFRDVDRPLLAILSIQDPALLPPGAADWPGLIAECVHQARGRRLPAWGRVNSVGLSHPLTGLAPWAERLLGIAARPQPGALHSVRTCVPGFGAAGRAVLTPGGGTFELPAGQSGHPLSPHFADRHPTWLRSGAPRASRAVCGYSLSPAHQPAIARRAS